MKKSGGTLGRPATRGRENPSSGKKQSKLSSLTSSATDEDFYSSLAQMAGDDDEDEDEDSMTEVDAKKLASSLADIDDLDSDLFGSSLGKKSTPKPSSKPTTKPAEKPVTLTTSNNEKQAPFKTGAGLGTQPKKDSTSQPDSPRRKFDISKYDSMDFDEDDPLAGLLSDDEDAITTKKKHNKTIKKTPVKTEPETAIAPPKDVERPKISRSRNQDVPQPDPLSSTEKTIEKKQEVSSPDITKPTTPRDTSTVLSPRGRRSQAKPKNELSFDSDDDLPGMEESPRPKPTVTKQATTKPTPKKKDDDLFGDDDGLFGLEEGKPASKPTAAKTTATSRFDQLLGGKKDNESEKTQRPKTIDDFLSNISTTSRSPDTPAKKALPPKDDDDFLFGSYSPSAASTGRARARPDTAPGSRRSVRFADELGLDDDMSGFGTRPATAPNAKTDSPTRRRRPMGERAELGDLSLGDDSSISQDKTKKNTSSASTDVVSPRSGPTNNTGGGRGGSDWLGLGGGDTGLELELPTYKPPTPARRQRNEPEQTVVKTSPNSSPRRRPGGDDDNDFLKMLGRNNDKDTTSQTNSIPRRTGRRMRDQSPDKSRNIFDLSTTDRDTSTSRQEHPAANQPQRSTTVTQQDINNAGALPVGKDQKEDIKFSTSQTIPARSSQLSTPSQNPALQESSSLKTPNVLDRNPKNAADVTPQLRDAGQFQETPRVHGTSQLRDTGQVQGIPPLQGTPQFQGTPQIQGTPQFQGTSQLQGTPQLQGTAQFQGTSQIQRTPQFQGAPQIQGTPQFQGTSQLQETPQLQGTSQFQNTPQFSSTPAGMPLHPSQSIGNEQKAQLEGEIHTLMKKLQDMEAQSRSVEQSGGEYVLELEAKIRRLQLENEHLQGSLDALKNRHQTEKNTIESSHKAHMKTLEESYNSRELRMKEETESQANYFNDRIRALENEKTALQASHTRKIQALDFSHSSELNRLKELHQQAIDEMRKENEEEIKRLRRLKDQEVSAVSSAHVHTKSLQSLMEQVLNSTKDVSDMRCQIEATHKSSITERESMVKARDEYLNQLQEKLVKQQAENDQERTRLQGLIAKMEINVREQTRQVDQEKWKLTQDEARVKTLQASLEEERRYTMEQIAADRAEIQRAREELIREQKRITTELQEEKRAVAMERAQLSSAHREIITREKHKKDTTIQAEAELEITATKVKQDSATLAVRQAKLKEGEERLAREMSDFEHRTKKFEEEKDRIAKLSLEVQRRSEEIGELCAEGARAREEGQEALFQAERLRQETEGEKADIESRHIVLHEKEKQLAQDRVSIAHERRMLEREKRNGRCRNCDVKHVTFIDTEDSIPALTTYDLGSPPQSPQPKTPDILLNSLELKRNFRRWESDKDKDEEFLEQESRFLHGLRKRRNESRPISSPS